MNNMTLPFQEKVYVGALFGHYSPGFRRLAPKGHLGCMLGSQVEVCYKENTSLAGQGTDQTVRHGSRSLLN